MQRLQKRIGSHIILRVSEDWSLTGLITEKLYWAMLKEDCQRTKGLRQRQQRDRRNYQQSLDVFAQEPNLVAVQLRHLETQVRAMRSAPGGTEDASRKREEEWLWLVRHVDGILRHLEAASAYANQIYTCSGKQERALLVSKLKRLIENHAGTIYGHITQ
ncbi:uncharacterized protein PG986_001916 [Apiospora aurea]|uniref:Uncharacterized protein n=1 Tax=Apiospora aurea TaxID=335848 RepID=A0ABR1QYD9_9PEZI